MYRINFITGKLKSIILQHTTRFPNGENVPDSSYAIQRGPLLPPSREAHDPISV